MKQNQNNAQTILSDPQNTLIQSVNPESQTPRTRRLWKAVGGVAIALGSFNIVSHGILAADEYNDNGHQVTQDVTESVVMSVGGIGSVIAGASIRKGARRG